MKLSSTSDLKALVRAEVLVVCVHPSELSGKPKGALKQLDKLLDRSLKTAIQEKKSQLKPSQLVSFSWPGQSPSVVICCVDEANVTPESLSTLGEAIGKDIKRLGASDVALVFPSSKAGASHQLRVLVRGIEKPLYAFDELKSEQGKKPKSLRLTLFNEGSIDRGSLTRMRADYEGLTLARGLVNTPANICTPSYLVKAARSIARTGAVSCTVKTKAQLEKLKAGGILSVGKGSAEAPCLIELKYSPKAKRGVPKVCLVGKGVTFDSGGYSLKSGEGMMGMKADMGGAATVLGIMKAVSIAKPNVAIHAFVPAVENMVAPHAMRPGDVITMASGKTVEVLNTDAEGRLILADALHFASKTKPDYILDYATLTGACMVALGESLAGLMSNDDELASRLSCLSHAEDEPCWHLPLPNRYKKKLESKVADVKNIGGRLAGALTAGLFLQHFVSAGKWAHIDLAGPTVGAKNDPDLTGGGYCVPTTISFFEQLVAGSK